MSYEPDFDIDLRRGEEAEHLVQDIIDGIQAGRTEVKRDDRAAETGNVYIEDSCLRRDGWHPSGIEATRSDYWAHVIADDVVVVAPVEKWKRLYRWARREGRTRECVRGSHPTTGVVVPRHLLLGLLADLDL